MTYCRNNPLIYVDPSGNAIEFYDPDLIKWFQEIMGIELKFENKDNPNLVTGFDVTDSSLSEMQDIFQEIIDHDELFQVKVKTERKDGMPMSWDGGANTERYNNRIEVGVDKKAKFFYVYSPNISLFKKILTGNYTDYRYFNDGENMLHEIIGHGYDHIKGDLKWDGNKEEKTIDENRARTRINQLYRMKKDIPLRPLK